jgi:hypothetical protein
MRKIRNVNKVWMGRLKGIDHTEDQDMDGRIYNINTDHRVCEWGVVCVGFMWLRIVTCGGNERSGSLKAGEFLD